MNWEYPNPRPAFTAVLTPARAGPLMNCLYRSITLSRATYDETMRMLLTASAAICVAEAYIEAASFFSSTTVPVYESISK